MCRRLREPLHQGRLHLVSTETSALAPGHMDGAVERAEVVARAVVDDARVPATPSRP